MSSGVKQPRPRGRASGNGAPPPPYRLYRSHPRSLLAFLRGEEDVLAPEREDRPARRIGTGRRFTWKKGVLVVLAAIAGWLLLSLALFLISSAQEAGIPASAQAELSPGGNMLTSANTILILGTDQRPPGSKEPGGR